MNVIYTIRSFFKEGNQRSIKAKRNIAQMLLYKGGNIIIGLLLVPMTINYVDSEKYGLWLTLSSMISWMAFCDIGINHGLRNRLAEALANNNLELGKKYVSTTYAILTLIFLPLMCLLLIAAHFIEWEVLLNIDSTSEGLLASVIVLIVYFCLNFILSTINIVILAEQRPADQALRLFIQQLASLLVIWILTLTTEGSLYNLCLALCIVPLSVVSLFNATLFSGRYKNIAPALKYVDFKLAPGLMKLGLKFFIIQIASIIQYQMINFIIMRFYGATEVTAYNIAFKYFNILMMVWTILTTPIWTAVTDALTKGDLTWIKNILKKYLKVYILFFIAGICMLGISSVVFKFWIGDKVTVSFIISCFVLLYNLTIMFGTIFVSIINGSGQLKTQMYASMVSPFVFIGTFFLCHHILLYGISSVLIAAMASNFNGLILAPIQCRQILKY